MRLDDLDPASNVEDLGRGGGGGGGLNLLGFLPLLLGRGLGCGTIGILAIVVVAFLMFSGGGGLLTGGQAPTTQQGSQGGNVPCDTAEELFACRVLQSTNQTWTAIFREQGQRYQLPTLKFYQQGAQSGCGAAQSAMGPFYCPPDRGVYLDTGFFRELSQRFGAAGDFAQAYVIAHEVGHHIQNLTGQAEAVSRAQQTLPKAEGNAQSVRLELQADCYAGVWAARNRDRLEPGDIEEGLRAAEAIGDDTLQGSSASPESFTHGTSAQRMKWLQRGLQTGDPAQCDTFSGAI
ncbi:neutral zinc metallopeptidase [Sphingomonas sp. 2R-10]|uniref:KPN_02809 family neutral zinc metallopeptidase n=1 Tax=Sphingomonas sp. 2R-10 TaxID=3045148 RepID=UPI000F767B02|nr:neutral zinc metallopeptidase [Sphingomonas sp. 2R-10]MDJ0278016.1 neutral zinc metallopeptidase [Sphingomonas sp. 2R-10]